MSSPDQGKGSRVTVTTLREEGNDLYKSGKIARACQKYQEAIKLSPRDPAPIRNLSAGWYELGHYDRCITRANQALKLMKTDPPEDVQAQIEKLKQRMAKAKIHNNDVSEADQRQRRQEVIMNLPRYRPFMFSTTEYYSVGHDVVTSLYVNDTFEKFSPESESISLFFGGVGDARNALQTITVLAQHEVHGTAPERRYHLALNDIHKTALARDLIVCILLDDLSTLDAESIEAARILNTIFFIYISTMMPPYAFDHLKETINRALTALQAGQQPLKWLYMHKKDMPSYITALTHWKEEASDVFTSAEIVNKVSWNMRTKGASSFIKEADPVYKNEKQLYIEAAALFPSKKMLHLHDTQFSELVEKYSKKPKAHAEKLKKHIEEHWHFNITLMDKQWYEDHDHEKFDIGFDPFELLGHFAYDEVDSKPRNPTRLFDHVAPFFVDAAKAIRKLEGRLQVEALLGDYIDVAENIQFGLFDTEEVSPEDGASTFRPKDFPTVFDFIHLSNVPDYVGGHLTTFLHAMPILRRAPSSALKANCLRNSDSWATILDYISEYQLISDDDTLYKLAQVAIIVRENNAMPYPLADYTFYTWAHPNPRHQFSALLPRKPFTKWFHALFFKLAIPVGHDIVAHMKIVFSPLNLTILFRLIGQLYRLGYPAHWLSEPLQNIIENNIVTTCRPPRKKPMRAADVKREYPEKKLCSAPFVPEMATLAQIFQPLLPFTLTSANVPPLDSIYKYMFSLPDYDNFHPQPSCLTLVFIEDNSMLPIAKSGNRSPSTNLRELLDPSWGDEVDRKVKGAIFEAFREQGLVVWSSFTWDAKKKEASVWMPESFVERVSEGWMMGIYRTDLWIPVFGVPAVVRKVLSKGERWEG